MRRKVADSGEHQLDGFDRRILDLFQRNTRLTSAALGEAVGLSPTACQRRLNRMRTLGVIESEITVVSPKAVGRPLTLIVEVVMERGDSRMMADFKKLAKTREEIVQCYYTTGRPDFFLIVSMKDMDEYDRFTQEVFFDNPDVKIFETFTVQNRTKVGLSIPIV